MGNDNSKPSESQSEKLHGDVTEKDAENREKTDETEPCLKVEKYDYDDQPNDDATDEAWEEEPKNEEDHTPLEMNVSSDSVIEEETKDQTTADEELEGSVFVAATEEQLTCEVESMSVANQSEYFLFLLGSVMAFAELRDAVREGRCTSARGIDEVQSLLPPISISKLIDIALGSQQITCEHDEKGLERPYPKDMWNQWQSWACTEQGLAKRNAQISAMLQRKDIMWAVCVSEHTNSITVLLGYSRETPDPSRGGTKTYDIERESGQSVGVDATWGDVLAGSRESDSTAVADILREVEKHKTLDSRVDIVGYAGGGALATVLGLVLAATREEHIYIWSFGAPALGDESFKVTHSRLQHEGKLHHVRVVISDESNGGALGIPLILSEVSLPSSKEDNTIGAYFHALISSTPDERPFEEWFEEERGLRARTRRKYMVLLMVLLLLLVSMAGFFLVNFSRASSFPNLVALFPSTRNEIAARPENASLDVASSAIKIETSSTPDSPASLKETYSDSTENVKQERSVQEEVLESGKLSPPTEDLRPGNGGGETDDYSEEVENNELTVETDLDVEDSLTGASHKQKNESEKTVDSSEKVTNAADLKAKEEGTSLYANDTITDAEVRVEVEIDSDITRHNENENAGEEVSADGEEGSTGSDFLSTLSIASDPTGLEKNEQTENTSEIVLDASYLTNSSDDMLDENDDNYARGNVAVSGASSNDTTQEDHGIGGTLASRIDGENHVGMIRTASAVIEDAESISGQTNEESNQAILSDDAAKSEFEYLANQSPPVRFFLTTMSFSKMHAFLFNASSDVVRWIRPSDLAAKIAARHKMEQWATSYWYSKHVSKQDTMESVADNFSKLLKTMQQYTDAGDGSE